MPAKTSGRRSSASSGYDFAEGEHEFDDAPRARTGHGLAKKKKRKRVRSPLWAKLVAALGVIVTRLGFGGIVAAKVVLGDLTSSIETADTSENGTGQTAKDAGSAVHHTLKKAGNETKEEAGEVTGIHKTGGTVGKAAHAVSHTGKKVGAKAKHTVKHAASVTHDSLTKAGNRAKAAVKKP